MSNTPLRHLAIAVPVLSYDNIIHGSLVAVLDLRTLQPDLEKRYEIPSWRSAPARLGR